jgi:hypothetical protein
VQEAMKRRKKCWFFSVLCFKEDAEIELRMLRLLESKRAKRPPHSHLPSLLFLKAKKKKMNEEN